MQQSLVDDSFFRKATSRLARAVLPLVQKQTAECVTQALKASSASKMCHGGRTLG